MKRGAGTSLPEQSLFFYVHQFLPDAINRMRLQTDAGMVEADIFIPSYNIAIEYDGSYWHKKKRDRDNQKNAILNANNIYVIHVREDGLPSLAPFIGQEINLRQHHWEEETYDYINKPLAAIAELTGLTQVAISVTKEMYQHDIRKIYAQVYNTPVYLNLTDYCAIDYWLYDTNAPLFPENIPQDEWVPAVLKCPNGNEMVLSRYERDYKEVCGKSGYNCPDCFYGIYCKFIRQCKKTDLFHPVRCDYMFNRIVEEINAGNMIGDRYGKLHLESWIFGESSHGMDIITWFLQDETTPKTRKKILNYFGMTPYRSTSLSAWTDKDIEILKKFRSHPECRKIQININDRREEANGRLQWKNDREAEWLKQAVDKAIEENMTQYIADPKNKDVIDKIVFAVFSQMPFHQSRTQYTIDEAIDILLAMQGKLRDPKYGRYSEGTRFVRLSVASSEQSRLDWDSKFEFWAYIQDELKQHGTPARLIFQTHAYNEYDRLISVAYDIKDLPKFHYSHGELIWLPATFFDDDLIWHWIVSV